MFRSEQFHIRDSAPSEPSLARFKKHVQMFFEHPAEHPPGHENAVRARLRSRVELSQPRTVMQERESTQ